MKNVKAGNRPGIAFRKRVLQLESNKEAITNRTRKPR